MKKILCIILCTVMLLLCCSCRKSAPIFDEDDTKGEDIAVKYAYYEYDGKNVRQVSKRCWGFGLANVCRDDETLAEETAYYDSVIPRIKESGSVDGLAKGAKSDGFAIYYRGETYVIMYDAERNMPLICDGKNFVRNTAWELAEHIKSFMGPKYELIMEDRYDESKFHYKLWFYDRAETDVFFTYEPDENNKTVLSKEAIEYTALTFKHGRYQDINLYKDEEAEMWCAFLYNENWLDDELVLFIDKYGNITGADYAWCLTLADGYPDTNFISQRLLKEYDAYYVYNTYAVGCIDQQYWKTESVARYEDGTVKYILSLVCDDTVLISKQYDDYINYEQHFTELANEYSAFVSGLMIDDPAKLIEKVKKTDISINDIVSLAPEYDLYKLTFDMITKKYSVSFLKKAVAGNRYYTVWHNEESDSLIYVLFEKNQRVYNVLDVWECDEKSVSENIAGIVAGKTTLDDVQNMYKYSTYNSGADTGDGNFSTIFTTDGSVYVVRYNSDHIVESVDQTAPPCISADDVNVLQKMIKPAL